MSHPPDDDYQQRYEQTCALLDHLRDALHELDIVSHAMISADLLDPNDGRDFFEHLGAAKLHLRGSQRVLASHRAELELTMRARGTDLSGHSLTEKDDEPS
ncbi:hypothetical protein FPZ12_020130 [Amycolatopsis acidicola]|uniref:Uncharacterized protein n=1 Tax=Amycolatopsis acidicola TaxID=2596893 RepID=A0A5N0V2R4_9PSEU|nr:hypothetical protein [Amycolatopsis acidicola]KAA9159419.1 hypothetical protein FPZ12_020130 [Amycolatopsis acidicola]